MAGNQKILKNGQLLFKEGDVADAMYIVRKGELEVYLHKSEVPVKLASIPEGGIVGEMAFFDQKPRSASVKANKDTEVSVVSKDDFSKLTKQIPKWFVTLMSALSERLRATNERLQKMEQIQAGVGIPFDKTLKLFYLVNLLVFKDAVKHGKDWMMTSDAIEKASQALVQIDVSVLKKILQQLVQLKFVDAGVDPYKNPSLIIRNRGDLERLTSFFSYFIQHYPKVRSVPSNLPGLVEMLCQLCEDSPYDQLTISMQNLQKEATIKGIKEAKDWDKIASFLEFGMEVFTVHKKENVVDSIRVQKKDCRRMLPYYKLLVAISEMGAP